MPNVILVPAEAEDIYSIKCVRKEVDPYLNSPFHVNGKQQEAWFNSVTEDPTKLLFIVCVIGKERNTTFSGVRTDNGCCGDTVMADTPYFVGYAMLTDIDSHHRRCLGQVQIAEDDRGNGYGTAAWEELLRIASNDLGMRKVWLDVHTDNEAAIGMYRKLGFQVEGRLKEHYWCDGEFIDALVMGIFPSTQECTCKGDASERAIDVIDVMNEDWDSINGIAFIFKE